MTVNKHYALAILTLVGALSYLDRGLMTLLLQPIKEDLQLSDTQLGFLTGIAFGLFYAVLGVPIARWADRGNRATLAALAIGLWGATVMSCVAVVNFSQLALARVAAAVGEAGCMPPTYSLIGDYFRPASERTRAMSIYWLASPVALLCSFAVGGWLNERVGWRFTFFLIGLPAVLVAILVKMSVVDPRTRMTFEPSRPLPAVTTILSLLWSRHTSRHLIVAIVLFFTLGGGLAPWYAAFMMRSHGMSTSEVGLWLGLIFGIGGIVGTLLGGHVSAHWLGRDERAQMRLSASVVACVVPFFLLFLLLRTKVQALLALVPLIIVGNFIFAPTFALLQRLVPDEMRATTLAVVMLAANLIGMGAGPQIVGVLSDLLMPTLGADSLRYAMLMVSLIALGPAYHLWRAGETVEAELAAVG